MLVLHDLDGDEHFFAPEHINDVSLREFPDNVRRTAVGLTNGDDHVVTESQMDVARLRAAWELRQVAEYDGQPLTGDLLIAVEMTDAGILMHLCDYTRRAREAAEAKAKPPLKDLIDRCAKRRDQLAEQVEQQLTRPSDTQYDDQA